MSLIKPLDRIDEIITLIYQGSLEAKPWQSFLHCLRERMNCDAAVLSLRPEKVGVREINIWDRCDAAGDMDIVKNYDGCTRVMHLDPSSNALIGLNGIYTLDEIIPHDQLKRSEYYLEVMRPNGVEYKLGMHFSEPTGWNCQVSIMNGPSKKNFGLDEKHFFLSLRPHLEHALRLYALLKRNEIEKEIYGEALDRLTIGTIILDGLGRVIDTNRVAKKILQYSSCLSLIDRRIVLSKAKGGVELNRLIKEAIVKRENKTTEPFVDVLRVEDSGGGSLGILVRTAPVSQWYQSEVSPSVIIYLDDLTQGAVPEQQIVARLFGLTQSEAMLATLLANGYTLAEAAAELNLTESSVRTYCKRIFAKMGVNRQAELVRMILKSVALLAGNQKVDENMVKERFFDYPVRALS